MQMHTAQSLLEVHGLADPKPGQRPARELRSTLWAFATSAVTAVVTWQRYRRDVDELQRMDDRMLADIGLSRSDIERSVRFGRQAF